MYCGVFRFNFGFYTRGSVSVPIPAHLLIKNAKAHPVLPKGEAIVGLRLGNPRAVDTVVSCWNGGYREAGLEIAANAEVRLLPLA